MQSVMSAGILYSAMIGLSTIAVPIYFIISGYLFFSKPFSVQRLKHQLLRILKLYLVWTVVYVPLVIRQRVLDGTSLFRGILAFVQAFIFSGSYFHLWFLPSLMFTLVFVSLIRNIKKCYAAIIVATLFIIGLNESYRFIFPQFTDISEIYEKVFLTTRNGLFFGTIYVYLGYIFVQCKIEIKRSRAVLGIAVSMLLLFFEAIFLFEYRGISVTNLTVFALPVSVYTFIFVQRQEVDIKDEKLLYLRKLSTVLFCVHPIVIMFFAFVNKHIVAISTPCTFVLVILGSTFVSVIIVNFSKKYKLISCFV